ncbi:hypothetical protein AVEN_100528-1 [Araneus ventricosus]|uniref:Uncharacterized protein n=1 Tax=Araneus ventricosus TaxID=182803 RepID=A0A4Y2JXQ4_ARAVE|nr:hypothetical protein AVEN_100528-1 [Araneus ventricosus]
MKKKNVRIIAHVADLVKVMIILKMKKKNYSFTNNNNSKIVLNSVVEKHHLVYGLIHVVFQDCIFRKINLKNKRIFSFNSKYKNINQRNSDKEKQDETTWPETT